MAGSRRYVNLNDMSISDKRRLLTELNTKVEAKIKSIEKAGIRFRGSEYDVSRKQAGIGRMTGKSLDKAINQQLDFLTPSNSNRFVRGLAGEPQRLSDVNRFKHYKQRYIETVNARNYEMLSVFDDWRFGVGRTPDPSMGGFEARNTPSPKQMSAKGLKRFIDQYRALGSDEGFLKWAREQQELDIEALKHFPVAQNGALEDLRSLTPTQFAALRHMVDIGAQFRMDYRDGLDRRQEADTEAYKDTHFAQMVGRVKHAVRK